MRNRHLAGLFAILLLCASALCSSAFADNTKAIGGTGGGRFFDSCRPGDAFIGIAYGAGKDLDIVTGICAVMRDGKPNRDETYRLISRGMVNDNGRNGATGTIRCPAGMAVRTLEVAMSAAHLVHAFAITCVDPLTGQRTDRAASDTLGGVGRPPTGVECGDGSYAYGLLGRSSDRMIAMGLMCTTVQPPVASAPPPPPIAQRQTKQTGRPKTTVPATSATFTGNWSVTTEDTAYTMSMTQTGNAVSGSYHGNDGSDGRFSGTVQAKVLRFSWTQTDGFAGTGKFTLADTGNTFDGSYNFGSNPDIVEGRWGGSRN